MGLLTSLSPTGWIIGGLVSLLVLGGTFGGGWYLGETHDAKIQATATAVAVQHAATEQAAADSAKFAKDYSADVADAEKRGAENQKASDAAARATAAVPALIAAANPGKPVAGKCPPTVIPKAVLHDLNDPALLGDTP